MSKILQGNEESSVSSLSNIDYVFHRSKVVVDPKSLTLGRELLYLARDVCVVRKTFSYTELQSFTFINLHMVSLTQNIDQSRN